MKHSPAYLVISTPHPPSPNLLTHFGLCDWTLAGLVVPPYWHLTQDHKELFFCCFFFPPADFLVGLRSHNAAAATRIFFSDGRLTVWARSVASVCLGSDPFAFSQFVIRHRTEPLPPPALPPQEALLFFCNGGRWRFDFLEEQRSLGGLLSCVDTMKPGDLIISELWIIQSQTAFYFIFKL